MTTISADKGKEYTPFRDYLPLTIGLGYEDEKTLSLKQINFAGVAKNTFQLSEVIIPDWLISVFSRSGLLLRSMFNSLSINFNEQLQ